MSKILLLEDDRELGKNLKLYLELKGFTLDWAEDVRGAKRLVAAGAHDLWLLDWNLPDGTGFEFLKGWRDEHGESHPPVFFLTAREDEESAIKGLSLGALDYLRKPFGQGELLIKIKKAVGEAHHLSKKIKFGELALDLDIRKAYYKEKELELRRKEFDLLELFVKNSDRVLSREDMLEKIDQGDGIFDRTVDSHISRIRKALKSGGATDLDIGAVYGVGYQIKKVG